MSQCFENIFIPIQNQISSTFIKGRAEYQGGVFFFKIFFTFNMEMTDYPQPDLNDDFGCCLLSGFAYLATVLVIALLIWQGVIQ